VGILSFSVLNANNIRTVVHRRAFREKAVYWRQTMLSVLRQKLPADWKRTALYVSFIAGAVLLVAFKLGTLLPGFSAQEITTLQQSGSLSWILAHPANAPYLVAVHLFSYISPDYLLWGRNVSALCGLLAATLFCGLAWYWHGRRNALLGTLLFVTSAWFLHTARLGTPDVMLFLVLALVAGYVWLQHKPNPLAVITGFILVAVALYVPGMIWFIAAGVIWRFKALDRIFRKNLWAVTVGGVLLLAALVPLGMAIYHHPETAKVLAGLPAEGWPRPLEVLRNLAAVPYHLFVHGPVMPERWLGNVAIMDAFTTAMFVLGAYVYLRNTGLKRVQLHAAALIAGAVLAGIDGAVSLSLIVPFVYIIAAAGVGFMIDRWLEVFPRNSIAKSAGYGLIGLAMLSASVYSIVHYFVAWPDAKATRMIYTEHRLPSGTIK